MTKFMNQPEMFTDDICANRHKQADTSVEANKTVKKARDREAVFTTLSVLKRGTLKDIAKVMCRTINEISGRLTELHKDGRIQITKDRRDGCRVYEVKK